MTRRAFLTRFAGGAVATSVAPTRTQSDWPALGVSQRRDVTIALDGRELARAVALNTYGIAAQLRRATMTL